DVGPIGGRVEADRVDVDDVPEPDRLAQSRERLLVGGAALEAEVFSIEEREDDRSAERGALPGEDPRDLEESGRPGRLVGAGCGIGGGTPTRSARRGGIVVRADQDRATQRGLSAGSARLDRDDETRELRALFRDLVLAEADRHLHERVTEVLGGLLVSRIARIARAD